MKFRSLLLSMVLVAGVSLSAAAFAQGDKNQDDKQKTQTPSSQTQPADQSQAASTDQSQSQTQPVADQDQPAADQDKGKKSDKKDKDKKEKKDKDAKAKHSGGKDDVDAIGNRKVAGWDWYSIESEIRMGKEYATQIEASLKLVTDPTINEYVNRVGQNLVRNSDAKVPFTIKVVDSDVINAMALPGGFFYVNSGLILAADNEAELAGVMAHEIAHVAARHTTRQLTRYQFINYASLPLIFVGGGIGLAAREAAGIGIPMTFLKFSRSFEAEADYLGIQYMYKAGYDPNEFVNFFEKVQAQEKKKPGSMAKVFTDHPQTPDRITKSQEEIATILPAKDQYIETTSEFNDMKARLATIENRHKVEDANNPNKPSLRRGQTSSSKDGDKKDDDRPTLKRRDQ
ncbi:MAG TPA: M48 family metallopeptidase [Candidatus Angelobacter sp.]|jgi:predicted Zn-dependent protease|nr:M48 family metallopeptidase [Candidatus Angelobacter sp.]